MNVEKSPKCRKKDETTKECMSRKIPEILKDSPGMERDQAVAIAAKYCSKSCSTKFLTTAEVIQLAEGDKLPLTQINTRTVKAVRPDTLYRTHMALHKQAKGTLRSKKVVQAHKIVADELQKRGFLHHQWDKLDSIYQQ